jgi:multiple sugar transport system permease protein
VADTSLALGRGREGQGGTTSEEAGRKGGLPFRWRLLIPLFIALMIVDAFPLAYAFIASVQRFLLSGRDLSRPFIGLQNYIEFASSAAFVNAAQNTLVLSASVVTLEILIAFALAVFLALPGLRFRGVYLLILMVPLLLSPVAVGLSWRLILHPDLGILNWLIGLVGLPRFAWLGDVDLAMPTIIAVDVWHETSALILIFYAGLQALPHEPLEAAKVDGASALQSLRHITLPLMVPIIVVGVLIRLVSAVKTYDLIYILTRGGPGTATETVSFLIWRTGLAGPLDIGEAAAGSVILLFVIVGLTVLLLRATDRLATA